MKKLFYWYILFHRKWKPPIKGPHARGTSIECLPELIHACEGKDHIFSSMVENELQSAKTKQVYPSLLQVKSFLNLEHSFFNCGAPTHVIMESWKIGNSEGFLTQWPKVNSKSNISCLWCVPSIYHPCFMSQPHCSLDSNT